MCDYIGHEFSAPYPDSVCINGYLWDADSCDDPGGPLRDGGDMPCPHCNHDEWVKWFCEEAEESGAFGAEHGQLREDNPFLHCWVEYPDDRQAFINAWFKGYDDNQHLSEPEQGEENK